MTTIRVSPELDVQTIIDTSKPRDKLIFNRGFYSFEGPLQLKSDRYYISRTAVFVKPVPFDGPMIRMVGEPLPPQTFFQRIGAWTRRFLHLPPRVRTLVQDFVLIGAGMELANAERCNVIGCMVTGADCGLRFSEAVL